MASLIHFKLEVGDGKTYLLLLKEYDLKMDQVAEKALQNIIVRLKLNETNFANAREMRNIFESVIGAMAIRTQNTGGDVSFITIDDFTECV